MTDLTDLIISLSSSRKWYTQRCVPQYEQFRIFISYDFILFLFTSIAVTIIMAEFLLCFGKNTHLHTSTSKNLFLSAITKNIAYFPEKRKRTESCRFSALFPCNKHIQNDLRKIGDNFRCTRVLFATFHCYDYGPVQSYIFMYIRYNIHTLEIHDNRFQNKVPLRFLSFPMATRTPRPLQMVPIDPIKSYNTEGGSKMA